MENDKYLNSKEALLVIDIQEDYTGTASKEPFPYRDSQKFIARINNIIEKALE